MAVSLTHRSRSSADALVRDSPALSTAHRAQSFHRGFAHIPATILIERLAKPLYRFATSGLDQMKKLADDVNFIVNSSFFREDLSVLRGVQSGDLSAFS